MHTRKSKKHNKPKSSSLKSKFVSLFRKPAQPKQRRAEAHVEPLVEVEQKERNPLEEFQYLTEGLKYEDRILDQEQYHPHKNEIRDSIALLILHELHTQASQAAVIMAKEDAKKIVNLLIMLKKHSVPVSDKIIFAFCHAHENMHALADLLLNAKIRNFLPAIEALFGEEKHLLDLANIYSSIDKTAASRMTQFLALNFSSVLELTRWFSICIKNDIPVTRELIEQVSSSLERTPNLRISNAFNFIHMDQLQQPAKTAYLTERAKLNGQSLAAHACTMFNRKHTSTPVRAPSDDPAPTSNKKARTGGSTITM